MAPHTRRRQAIAGALAALTLTVFVYAAEAGETPTIEVTCQGTHGLATTNVEGGGFWIETQGSYPEYLPAQPGGTLLPPAGIVTVRAAEDGPDLTPVLQWDCRYPATPAPTPTQAPGVELPDTAMGS